MEKLLFYASVAYTKTNRLSLFRFLVATPAHYIRLCSIVAIALPW